jgi:hypothetical protein
VSSWGEGVDPRDHIQTSRYERWQPAADRLGCCDGRAGGTARRKFPLTGRCLEFEKLCGSADWILILAKLELNEINDSYQRSLGLTDMSPLAHSD